MKKLIHKRRCHPGEYVKGRVRDPVMILFFWGKIKKISLISLQCKISLWSANNSALIHCGVCQCHHIWGNDCFPSNSELQHDIAFLEDPKVQSTHFPHFSPNTTDGTSKSPQNEKEYHLNQTSIFVFQQLIGGNCKRIIPNSQAAVCRDLESQAAEIRKDQRKVLQVPKAWQVGVHVELGIRAILSYTP